jgi:hypothetical protein
MAKHAAAKTLPTYDALTKQRDELAAVCERLLAVIDELMPGVGAIAVKDYAELNDAPIAARKVIAAAKP